MLSRVAGGRTANLRTMAPPAQFFLDEQTLDIH